MANSTATFTDRVRNLTGQYTARIGKFLAGAGVHPDHISLLGFVMVGIAAILIAMGQLQVGGLILLLGLPLDAVDGAVARAMERSDQFGGVLDSTLDRYADGLIFGALGYYFASLGQLHNLVLALAALMGSFAVSYVRARAGEAGISVKVGLFTRLERVIIILLTLLLPALLVVGMWILALGTNFTALQRVWFVYRKEM